MSKMLIEEVMMSEFGDGREIDAAPIRSPLSDLLGDKVNDAICQVHLTKEDYMFPEDRRSRGLSFVFCRKEKYPEAMGKLANLFPVSVVAEYIGNLDMYLDTRLKPEITSLLSELISTRYWVLPIRACRGASGKFGLAPQGAHVRDLMRRYRSYSTQLCLRDVLVLGKPLPNIWKYRSLRGLQLSILFANTEMSSTYYYDGVARLGKLVHEIGTMNAFSPEENMYTPQV